MTVRSRFGSTQNTGNDLNFTFHPFCKHLPLSTVGPIRSTGPFRTIIIAVVFMPEAPSRLQWIGVIIILGSFDAFSLIEKREGIRFYRNKWVWFMVGATILGACSSVYDKFLLLQQNYLAPATVQSWFSIYLVAALSPFYLG